MKLNKLHIAMSMALIASAAAITGCVEDGSDGATGVTGVAGTDGTDGVSSVETPNAINVGLTELAVAFDPVALPVTDADKNAVTVTDRAEINGNMQNIGYTKLIATGETDNGETFGLMKDFNDQAITFPDGSTHVCNGTTSDNGVAGSGLDFYSILQKNGELHMVAQFECQVGAMYKAKLDQDNTTGALSVQPGSLEFISQKDEFGGFVHCAGQTTPWNSHLGSEEYETDAKFVEDTADANGLTSSSYYNDTAAYWGDDATLLSPYYYGWTPEVQINGNGDAVYTKHYSMGRFSHELSYVMPDEKTVYMSDDGTNVGLFMFVADTAGDLSSGSLYAAKWNQISDAGMGSANISWIDLGNTDSASIRTYLDPDGDVKTNDAIKFSQIFDTEEPQADGSCATAGFKSVNTTFGNECLMIKDINNDGFVDDADNLIASRLETRRFANYMGATTEFRKEEGITFNARDNKLYVAMSEVARGMEDFKKYGSDNDSYDLGGNNDVRITESNACGGVYELDVAADSTIGSDFVAYSMKGLIAGTEVDYSGTNISTENECDVNGLANPDNVTFLEGSDILVIGEDGDHENNMIWAYNIKDKSLNRILTTPVGAETTSPFWYKDVNGFGYMTAVTQHPDETSDLAGQSEAGVIGTFDFQ